MADGGTQFEIKLDPEHTAMLDAICEESGTGRTVTAKALLVALLEDDAAAHGAFSNPDDKIIVLRNWKAGVPRK